MSGDQLPDQTPAIVATAARIERAMGHLATATELKLADIHLDGRELTPADQEALRNLGESILSSIGLGMTLARDIAPLLGGRIELNGNGISLALPAAPETPTVEAELTRLREPVPLSAAGQLAPPAHKAESVSKAERSTKRTRREDVPKTRAPSVRSVPKPDGDTSTKESGVLATQEFPSSEELYQGLLSPDRLPKPEQPLKGKPVRLEKLGANKVRIGNAEWTLKGHELFLLNALLLTRNTPMLGSQLRALGFQPNGSPRGREVSFSVAIKNLIERFTEAGASGVLTKQGPSTKPLYILSPNLEVVDVSEPDSKVKKKIVTPKRVHPAAIAVLDKIVGNGSHPNGNGHQTEAPMRTINFNGFFYEGVRNFILSGSEFPIIAGYVDLISLRKALQSLAETEELLSSEEALRRYAQANQFYVKLAYKAENDNGNGDAHSQIGDIPWRAFEIEFSTETWALKANCLGQDPEIFYPEKGGSSRGAKRICNVCPVMEPCLEYALRRQERYGVWGGKSERERRKVLIARGVAVAEPVEEEATVAEVA